MTMSSKERVLAAFAHKEGDRVPAWLGASSEWWAKAKKHLSLDDEGLLQRVGDDFRRVMPNYIYPDTPLSEGVNGRTIFGRRTERHRLWSTHFSSPGPCHVSREVHEYPWPDSSCVDVSHIREAALPYHDRYAMMGGGWSPFWHDAIDLIGMENLMMAMYDTPEIVDALMTHIV